MSGAKLCKAERLEVAASVAPLLRSSRPRVVNVVGKDGRVLRQVTHHEVVAKLLAEHKIEIETRVGVRPDAIVCACGRIVKVALRGVVPTQCKPCNRKGFNRARPPCPKCGGPIKSNKKPLPKQCARCHLKEVRTMANPRRAKCWRCQKPLGFNLSPSRLNRSRGGRPFCLQCHKETERRQSRVRCSYCPKVLNETAMRPSQVARRGGKPPRCASCALRMRSGGDK